MKLKYLAVLTLVVFLIGGSAAQTEEIPLDELQSFEDTLDNCTGSACTTDDSAQLSVDNGVMTIDSGSTGFCGEAGYSLSGQMPEDYSKLVFESRAERDSWGSPIQGVNINDEMVFNYDVDPPSRQEWGWSQHEVDVSSYAGNQVNVSFVIGDTSSEYCDMSDHSKILQVRDAKFVMDSSTTEYDSIDLQLSKDNLGYGDSITLRVVDGQDNLLEPEEVVARIRSPSGDILTEDQLLNNPSDGEISESDFSETGEYTITAEVESGSENLTDRETFTLEDSSEPNYDSIEFKIGRDSVTVGEEVSFEVLDSNGNLVNPDNLTYAILDPNGELMGAEQALENPRTVEITESFEDQGVYTIRARLNARQESFSDTEQLKINFESEVTVEDLNDVDNMMNEAALIYPSEAKEDTVQSARDLADRFGLEAVSDRQDSYDFETAIIYGGPAINRVTQNLASEDLAWSMGDYSEGQGRLNLVSQEGATAVVISGYNTEARKRAESYFTDLAQGENKDAAEGQQKLTLSVSTNDEKDEENKESSEPPYLSTVNYPSSIEKGDEAEFEVGVRNRGQERKDVEIELSYESPLTRLSNYYELTVPSNTEMARRFSQKFVKSGMAGNPMDAGKVDFNLNLWGEDGARLDQVQGSIEITESENDSASTNQSEDYRPITLDISEGWNMVSVPGFRRMGSPAQVEGFYISDIRDDCDLQGYEGYYSWRLEGGDWEHPEAVKYNQGVYIKASESCEAEIGPKWPVSGEPVEDSEQLEEGWNMISVESNTRLENLETDCQFEKFKQNKIWHYSGQQWQSFNEGLLQANKGYYVKAAESCQLGVSQKPPTPTGNFFKIR